MLLDSSVKRLTGKEVMDWNEDIGIRDGSTVIYRVALPHEDWPEVTVGLVERLMDFLQDPAIHTVTGLIVGCWSIADNEEDIWWLERELDHPERELARLIETIVTAHDKLPRLRSLFFGAIPLAQFDFSPLFLAYPWLQHFGLKDGTGFMLGTLSHTYLRTLIIGERLAVGFAQALFRAQLPRLEYLELCLGGIFWEYERLLQNFDGERFPRLRHLGLRNSGSATSLARMLSASPLLERLEELDLSSFGTLSEAGVQALLNSPSLHKLKKLDIHGHACSQNSVLQLQRLGIEIDARTYKDAYPAGTHDFLDMDEDWYQGFLLD